MDATAAAGKAAKGPGKFATMADRVLHNPTQLRVLLAAAILGVWYAGFASPMTTEIDETARRTEREKKRLTVAVEVERLRAQVARFHSRLPVKTDPNEWVEYMLEGVRRFPLRMVLLDTDGTRDVGPYKAIVVKLQVEGRFHDADEFLRWVENNERLLRVDSLRLEPVRGQRGVVDVQMIVLGVMG
jgi:Tfp pilus assembly protein PilO